MLETTIDLGDLGERTAVVYYDFFPYEAPCLRGPNPHPASAEEITIGEVNVSLWPGKPDVNVVELLSSDAIKRIEDEIRENEAYELSARRIARFESLRAIP